MSVLRSIGFAAIQVLVVSLLASVMAFLVIRYYYPSVVNVLWLVILPCSVAIFANKTFRDRALMSLLLFVSAAFCAAVVYGRFGY